MPMKTTVSIEYMSKGAGNSLPNEGPMMAAMPHMMRRGCHSRFRRFTTPPINSAAKSITLSGFMIKNCAGRKKKGTAAFCALHIVDSVPTITMAKAQKTASQPSLR